MGKQGHSVKSERQFQVLLLVLGFVLGVGGTYYWQLRQEKANTEAVVAILRAGVENEISALNDKIVLLRKSTDASNSEANYIRDRLSGSPHDPSAYLPAARELGNLNPVVLRSIDWYVRELKESHEARERLLLLRLNSNTRKDEYEGGYEGYVLFLEDLRRAGYKLLDDLNQFYPSSEK